MTNIKQNGKQASELQVGIGTFKVTDQVMRNGLKDFKAI